MPILCLPDYPKSGQGKEDLEYANMAANKSRSRELFFGWFSLAWTLVCIGVALYILRQMSIIDEAEYYAGITDEYDNVNKGLKVFCLFMVLGVFGCGICGTGLAWVHRRWWILHQGNLSIGDLSIHGFDGVVVNESQSVDDYQQMANYK